MSLQGQFNQIEQDIRAFREKEKDQFLNVPEYTKKDYKDFLNVVPITFDTYQEGTMWTFVSFPEMQDDVHSALGLAEEVGELVGHTLKRWRNHKGEFVNDRKEKILAEASDVLYYLSALMLSYGIKMSDVAKYNQLKLVSRKKNGTIKGEGSDR